MKWIKRYNFFLFDFDGLLVDTERLHFQAYVDMMARRGYELKWSFDDFCRLAHRNATSIRETLYATFNDLDPDWEALYAEKKEAYGRLLSAGNLRLMPGVKRLLGALTIARIPCCVVTNSTLEQTRLISSHLPILQTIPHWVTRENYGEPKPHPECYLTAIERYAHPKDTIIGFEDTLRGWEALQAACSASSARVPVLICSKEHPLFPNDPKMVHFPSFAAIPDDWDRFSRSPA